MTYFFFVVNLKRKINESSLKMFLMKEQIKFNASIDLQELISAWKDWLLKERRYSAHTADAYLRDLSFFINFFDMPDVSFLTNL